MLLSNAGLMYRVLMGPYADCLMTRGVVGHMARTTFRKESE